MKHTLLIADDSPHKIMLLQGMLAKKKWKGDVLVATTTEDAKNLIDAHPAIGFAFIDFYIPSENGPTIINHLKQKNPDARIALVSSSDNYDRNEEAKAAGAETCICTSYEAEEVERMLTEVLEEWMSQ